MGQPMKEIFIKIVWKDMEFISEMMESVLKDNGKIMR